MRPVPIKNAFPSRRIPESLNKKRQLLLKKLPFTLSFRAGATF
jgi:hypothetical protein